MHQNPGEKISSSLSFPILPSANTSSCFKSSGGDSGGNLMNLNHSYDAHSSSFAHKLKAAKKEAVDSTPNNMPKFGHAAHVEEDSERLLEIELKHAAKQNEAKTNMLYETSHSNKGSTDRMHIDCNNNNNNHNEEEEVDDVDVDEDNGRADQEERVDVDEELEEEEPQFMQHHQHQHQHQQHMQQRSKRLERANSHYRCVLLHI